MPGAARGVSVCACACGLLAVLGAVCVHEGVHVGVNETVQTDDTGLVPYHVLVDHHIEEPMTCPGGLLVSIALSCLYPCSTSRYLYSTLSCFMFFVLYTNPFITVWKAALLQPLHIF